jgi:hypothetical protein
MKQKYTILEHNLSAFKTLIERLSKKATKLKLPAPVVTEIGERYLLDMLEYQHMKGTAYEHDARINHKVPVVDVEIEAEDLVVNGFSVLAKIEPHPNGVLVKQFSDTAIPDKYYHTDTHCDHCNTNRQRKHVWLLNKDDTYIQVGESCVADFTRAGNADLLQQLLFHSTIFTTISEWDDAEAVAFVRRGGWSSGYIEVLEFIAICVAETDTYGYIPSREAGSTAGSAYKQYYFLDDNPLVITDKHREVAREVIAWVKSYTKKEGEPTDNYRHNLAVICADTHFSPKEIGFVGSAYYAYTREKQKAKAKEEILNEYPSHPIGKMIELTLTKTKTTSFPAEFGLMFIHTFKDAEGHTYVWKTGNSFDKTEPVKVKCKVKEYSEYRGIKQAVVTHLKEICV